MRREGQDPNAEAGSIEDAAAGFAALARRYCAFIDTMHSLAPTRRVVDAIPFLADLVASAVGLPQGVDVTEAEVERANAPRVDLGTFDYYYEVFDPFIRDELVIGSLADDLADIYVDLREGIDLLEAGHPNDAVWQRRFDYENHWGDHAVDALRALHRLATGRGQDIATDPQTRSR